ncbi:MAG: MFS transporter [candidate division WOR-3 bacterium]|nr:MFS transporter [candidate division WOR-3 bacterium]
MSTSGDGIIADSHRKNIVLFVTTLGSFLTPFMGSSINVALPNIGKEFNMNALLLSWIPTSYLLAAAMSLVPIGRVADMLGRRKVFFAGVTIFSIFSFLCGISNNASFLLGFRVIQGIGGAMIFGTSVAILTEAFPLHERGRALGINVAGVYLGLSLGPFIGGFLTHNFGWRTIFFLNTIIGILMLIMIIFSLKMEGKISTIGDFDYTGTLIYSPALFFFMYGLSLLPGFPGLILLIIGFILIWLFIRWESRVIKPLLNIHLFKANPAFLFSNLAALINYSATSAVSFLLSLYLQYLKGLPPQKAGLILIAQPITMTIFSPFAGRLSDKVQPGIIASTGMGLTSGGLLLLSFLNKDTGVDLIITYLVILGFGFALFSSPNTNAVMSSVEMAHYGVASSTLATMRLLGQMSSMGFVMLIFSLLLGRVKITPEIYPSFMHSLKISFYIFTGLCILGIFASLRRGRIERK